jgi:hypothetical protein
MLRISSQYDVGLVHVQRGRSKHVCSMRRVLLFRWLGRCRSGPYAALTFPFAASFQQPSFTPSASYGNYPLGDADERWETRVIRAKEHRSSYTSSDLSACFGIIEVTLGRRADGCHPEQGNKNHHHHHLVYMTYVSIPPAH